MARRSGGLWSVGCGTQVRVVHGVWVMACGSGCTGSHVGHGMWVEACGVAACESRCMVAHAGCGMWGLQGVWVVAHRLGRLWHVSCGTQVRVGHGVWVMARGSGCMGGHVGHGAWVEVCGVAVCELRCTVVHAGCGLWVKVCRLGGHVW